MGTIIDMLGDNGRGRNLVAWLFELLRSKVAKAVDRLFTLDKPIAIACC
ncbi:hypothetical protein Amal_03648 [Acetobacter malorum]|uniref:Uncharacterized protein n=1 Tax=Acetobacter malorum TaxID=178901 RepID=A0A177G5X6_9PROT|nr:hypothetical protein [Acetobacter malorum]OAG75181.1 hypothetical protein Amal_03648 [Acetobacter malorum]